MGDKLSMSNPFVKRVLRAVLPNYRGRRVYGVARGTVTYYGTLYSGGTRNEWYVLDLRTFRVEPVGDQPFLRDSAMHTMPQAILPGTCVVKLVSGSFSYVQIIGHPDDLAQHALYPDRTEYDKRNARVLAAVE